MDPDALDPDEIRLIATPGVADLQCGSAAYERLRRAVREAAPDCGGDWDTFRMLRIADVSATEPQRRPGRFDWIIGVGCFIALLSVVATFIVGLLSIAQLVRETLSSALS